MKAQFKAFATTGVAIVGAGIIAAPSIMTAPPTDISVRAEADRAYAIDLAANVEALQLQKQFDALLAGSDLVDRVQEAITYIIEVGFGSGFRDFAPATDPIDGTFRLAEGFGASAVRTLYGAALVPLGVIAAVQAVAAGTDPGVALAELLTQTIDGPAWAANPLLYALRDVLIEPLGGEDGFFADAQRDLAQAGTALGQAVIALLGLRPAGTTAATGTDPFARAQRAIEYIVESGFGSGFEEYERADGVVDGFFRLSEGFGAAAVRTASSAVLLPLGLLDVVGSFVDDERDPKVTLAHFITQTVDGPSWAVNPVLFALRDALIEPLGGAQGVFADAQNQLQLTSKKVGAAIVSGLALDTAEASVVSKRQPDAGDGSPDAQNTGTQVLAMRFAQSGPTAVPGTGKTLDLGAGAGFEDSANGQPNEQKANDRGLKGDGVGDKRQPKFTGLRSGWQQQRVEREQRREDARADRQQQQPRQSTGKTSKVHSSKNAE